jgi:hypothetical protein
MVTAIGSCVKWPSYGYGPPHSQFPVYFGNGILITMINLAGSHTYYYNEVTVIL